MKEEFRDAQLSSSKAKESHNRECKNSHLANRLNCLTDIHLQYRKGLSIFAELLHQEAPKWCCQPAVMRRWFNDVPNLKKGKIMMNKTQRPNTRAGIFFPRTSDQELLQQFTEGFANDSKQELVDTYNTQENIYGVHAQLVFLHVLHNVFLEKFGESPIIVKNDTVYCLGPKIFYSKELDSIFPITEN